MTLESLDAWDVALGEAKGKADGDPHKPPPAPAILADTEEVQDDKDPAEDEAHETDAGTETAAEVTEEGDGKEKTGGRDYSQFDEADRPFLKQMSKPAFEHFAAKLTTLKTEIAQKDQAIAEFTGGKTLPDAWYNDPGAGELSPEFKTVKTEFEKAQAETFQLTNILNQYERGQLKYDEATGQFSANTDESAPDPAVARMIDDRRKLLFEKQKDLAAKGNGITENFGKIYKQAEAEMKTGAVKVMPWLADPKHENHKYVPELLKQFPRVFQNHPVTTFAAQVAVVAVAAINRVKALEQQLATRNGVRKDRKMAGPIPGRANGKTTAEFNADKKLTLEDFQGGSAKI